MAKQVETSAAIDAKLAALPTGIRRVLRIGKSVIGPYRAAHNGETPNVDYLVDDETVARLLRLDDLENRKARRQKVKQFFRSVLRKHADPQRRARDENGDPTGEMERNPDYSAKFGPKIRETWVALAEASDFDPEGGRGRTARDIRETEAQIDDAAVADATAF